MFATEWIMRHEERRLRRMMNGDELATLTHAMLSADSANEVYWIYRLLLRSQRSDGA